jgi:hypothetical protein
LLDIPHLKDDTPRIIADPSFIAGRRRAMNRRQFLIGLIGASTASAAIAETAKAASLPEAAGAFSDTAALSRTDAEYSILMRAMVRRGMFPAPGRKWRRKPRIGRRYHRR